MSEPAILVRRLNNSSQIWSMEKLENKLIDMREMYEECKDRASSPMVSNIVLRTMLLLSLYYNLCHSIPSCHL